MERCKYLLMQMRAKRKKEARDSLIKEEILQDDRFFFIAGYTSGGVPYGVIWEEMGLIPWDFPEVYPHFLSLLFYLLLLKSGKPGKCKRIWQVVRNPKMWYDYGQDIRRIRS